MTTLRIQALRSLAAVEMLRDPIDALNRASRRPCPFSTFEYLRTFLAHDEHGAREEELLFLAAFDGDALVGYLALRKHATRMLGVPYHRVDVLLSHDTDRPHVVARAADEASVSDAFYRYLFDRERGWSSVEIAMQDAESKLATPPPVSPLRFYARRSESMPNTTIPLPHGSLRAYFESVHAAQRKNMARLCRRLLAAGRVEVVSSASPRARPALLDLYLDLESRSWKEAARAGIRRDPRRVAFFRDLCGPEQPLAVGFDFVLLDDLPIAAMLAGSFAGTLYGLETCFDREHEDLGPGHLLALMTMRRAIDGGHRAFNFNGNYAYYKTRMGGVVTETSAVQIYRVGTLPWMRARAGELARRLRPREEAAAQRFNTERRRVEGQSDGKPQKEPPRRSPREAERARTRDVLHTLDVAGAAPERLAGARLEALLPFSTGKKEAA